MRASPRRTRCRGASGTSWSSRSAAGSSRPRSCGSISDAWRSGPSRRTSPRSRRCRHYRALPAAAAVEPVSPGARPHCAWLAGGAPRGSRSWRVRSELAVGADLSPLAIAASWPSSRRCWSCGACRAIAPDGGRGHRLARAHARSRGVGNARAAVVGAAERPSRDVPRRRPGRLRTARGARRGGARGRRAARGGRRRAASPAGSPLADGDRAHAPAARSHRRRRRRCWTGCRWAPSPIPGSKRRRPTMTPPLQPLVAAVSRSWSSHAGEVFRIGELRSGSSGRTTPGCRARTRTSMPSSRLRPTGDGRAPDGRRRERRHASLPAPPGRSAEGRAPRFRGSRPARSPARAAAPRRRDLGGRAQRLRPSAPGDGRGARRAAWTRVFRTDENGRIVVESDGRTLTSAPSGERPRGAAAQTSRVRPWQREQVGHTSSPGTTGRRSSAHSRGCGPVSTRARSSGMSPGGRARETDVVASCNAGTLLAGSASWSSRGSTGIAGSSIGSRAAGRQATSKRLSTTSARRRRARSSASSARR